MTLRKKLMHNQDLQKIINRRIESKRPIHKGQIAIEQTLDTDPDNPESYVIDVYYEDMADCDTAIYTSAVEAQEDYRELMNMLPITGVDILNQMWTKQTILYKGESCKPPQALIPAHTLVQPATNLAYSKDGKRGYWATPWEGMTEEAVSWYRNYGFHINDDEVEKVPQVKTQPMMDLSIDHISREDVEELERLAMEYRRETEKRRLGPVPFRVVDHEYGFVIYARTDVQEVMEECSKQHFELSDDFWRIMDLASYNKSVIINFDTDADVFDDLPIAYKDM